MVPKFREGRARKQGVNNDSLKQRKVRITLKTNEFRSESDMILWQSLHPFRRFSSGRSGKGEPGMAGKREVRYEIVMRG
jgi:hypothetical protein